MKYKFKQNAIPECPYCGVDIECDMGDEGEGVQHIALQRNDAYTYPECDECYEEYEVHTLVAGELYTVSKI